MGTKVRLAVAATALALAVPLISACTNGSHQPTVTHVGTKTQAIPLSVKISAPAANTMAAPVTSEIVATIDGGFATAVTLTDTAGDVVQGAWRPDRSAWVPSTSLKFGMRYTAAVVATTASGATKTVTTSFTTMPNPSAKPITTAINLKTGTTYGVGMPIVLDFSTSIPTTNRADVERRLFVASSPPQLGIWSWASPTQVIYRPRTHWRTGTSVSVRTALAGLPIDNRVIDKDQTATFSIGKDLEYNVSNAHHTLTVTSGGKVLHTYPISLGKASTASWSGNFVIMSRQYYTVFDTLDQPGGYRTPVNYAERITWSGTFIHSAPWSVYAQGHFNVSHGCVNVAPANAAWIYKNSQVGDPVSITGTGRTVANGNGWTAWNMSWADFAKGSALGESVTTPSVGSVPAV
jgi:lipoprotein-anchoring transpeptidase ErfK/SrfK